MTNLFVEHSDATQLDPEERNGLLQSWITTRADLNAAEKDNIDAGAAWAYRRRRSDMLGIEFATALHKHMFNQVWSWAGTFRRTDRNIGIAAHLIGQETAQLFDDVRYWLDNDTYAPDETAVRLHHRLVFVHPFPNGNGRHARLMADLLIRRMGAEAFSWGSGSHHDLSELRSTYIDALRRADQHDYATLVAFARA